MNERVVEARGDVPCYVCGRLVPAVRLCYVRVYSDNGGGGPEPACAECARRAEEHGVEMYERDGRHVQIGPWWP
jgi:hypothetical protein